MDRNGVGLVVGDWFGLTVHVETHGDSLVDQGELLVLTAVEGRAAIVLDDPVSQFRDILFSGRVGKTFRDWWRLGSRWTVTNVGVGLILHLTFLDGGSGWTSVREVLGNHS